MPLYKSTFTQIKKAVHNYHMISDGDLLAVGLSGGKDSMCLLYLLNELKKHSHLSFDLCAVHIDYGWENDAELSLLKEFSLSLGIPCHIEKINYSVELTEVSCSVCSRVRRGALIKKSHEIGAQKLVLAHHSDDAVQTVLLNLTDGGRFRSFKPVIHYPEQGLSLIRPLIYVSEAALIKIKDEQRLPVINSRCPLGECSNRANATQILHSLEQTQPHIKQKIIHALEHLDMADIWR